MPLRILALVLTATLLAHVPSASACRYTVRDVAFVNLGDGGYRLLAFVDSKTPADWRNNFTVMADATFIDTNLESAMIDVARDPQNKAIDFLKAADARGDIKLPAMVLVSPKGDVHNLSKAGADWQKPSWEGMASVIQSPARKAIMQPIFESYAVVVLIEGKDRASNELAKQSVEGAIQQIDKIRHAMPKPTRVGPKLVSIKAGDRAAERFLLWSMGIEAAAGDDPSVVVVLGRGRKIGPVITGPAIVQTDVFEVLNVIGQDCECGLDRKWMQGVSFPTTFGDDFHKAVQQNLGFNPRDDAVIAEMNRILAKGPVPVADLATGIPSTAEQIDPLLGYTEIPTGQIERDSGTAPSAASELATNLTSEQAGQSTIKSETNTGGGAIVWQYVGIGFAVLLCLTIAVTVVIRRRSSSNMA